MARSLGGTASGPDLAALARAFLDALPYTHAAPIKAREHTLIERPLPSDWRERLLAPAVDGFGVEWEGGSVNRTETTVVFDLPDDTVRDPLALLAPLPFELAVMAIAQDYWPEHDYRPPAIGGDHALLGWGMAWKGAAYDRSIVSRRWLDHGPYRVLRGAHDTTFVQFHDLAADGPTSLAQAKPGHDWIAAGFLRPKHRYAHDIAGVYTKPDRLLRIVVNGRAVSAEEMRDACAARRDGRDDRDRPLANIAYVFVDEAEARAHLDQLWLHGLECRVADARGERRLDDTYRPALDKPAWA